MLDESVDLRRIPPTAGPRPSRASGGRRERTLAYRPQLDGLRAIAVLLVFVFHAVPSRLRGGFIGVDVFFVLSGYLITLILLEQRSPRALGSFYVRRIKRLLPASLLLLIVVAVRESVWGSVLEHGSRFREIRATTLYVANWNLIARSDEYFAESESASPLRHMWSLAVEEQFYLVWPVLLLVVVWLCRGRLGISGLVAVVAAGASVVAMAALYAPANLARAYYGTDTRVFQPLIGAVLAIGTCWLARRSGRPTNPSAGRPNSTAASFLALVVGCAGLGAIALMAVHLDGNESSYFRGGAVAVAVVAAGLIWALERSAALATIVGCWPLAALGRISYGFYLWHWPVILWVHPADDADWMDRRVVNVAQFGLTLAIAIASFVLIERPIRSRRASGPMWHTFGAAALAMAMVIGSSSWLLRPPSTGSEGIAADAVDDPSVQACPDQPHPCVKYEPGDPAAPTVVLVGDSTAQMYEPALLALAEENGFRYVQAAMGGCPIGDRLIATGIDGELHKPSNFMCYEAIPGVYQEVVDLWSPDLIIATSWNESNQHVTDGELVERGTDRHRAESRAALEQAVDSLTANGAHLVFLTLLPGGPSVECLDASPMNEGTCLRPVPSPPPYLDTNGQFSDLAATRDDVLGVVDLIDVVCPGAKTCPLSIDDVVVRYDGGHFTGTFSRGLAPVLESRLAEFGTELGSL